MTTRHRTLSIAAFALTCAAPSLVSAPTSIAHAGSRDRAVYEAYGCVNCHADDGNGSCDLRGANHHFPDDADLRAFIDKPSSRHPGSKMPAYADVIDEDDYPMLIQHVRELARD